MRSSEKLGDLEDQFSADVTSVDHRVCAGSVLPRKHIDQRYAHKVDVSILRACGARPSFRVGRIDTRIADSDQHFTILRLGDRHVLQLHSVRLTVAVKNHCAHIYYLPYLFGLAPIAQSPIYGPAKGLMRRSRIAVDEPSDCCKQDAHGYAAHQHADNALKRP